VKTHAVVVAPSRIAPEKPRGSRAAHPQQSRAARATRASTTFAPNAVTYYRVWTSTRAVMRQRFAYGRGHEQLVAKHAQLGSIQSRLAQRWKLLGVASARLPGNSPGARPRAATAVPLERHVRDRATRL